MKQMLSTPAATSQAPDFKKVRKYLDSNRQRDALDAFIETGWSPAELGEFARQVFLAPGRTYPAAASYQYAMEKGADHPYAVDTLAAMRKRGFTMPPFNRPVPKEFAWDHPENPEHTAEIRADIDLLARLLSKREAGCRGQPRSEPSQPIPKSLWSKLFRLRNRYHSLADTIQFEGLSEETVAEVLVIARCLQSRGAYLHLLPAPDPNKPVPPRLWKTCFSIRLGYGSLKEALKRRGLAEYRW